MTRDVGNPAREPVEEAEEFIRGVVMKLRELNSSTEENFLSVGACLQKLSCQSTTIAETARSIVDVAAGAGVEKETQRLREVVVLIDRYFGGCQEKFQGDSGPLIHMLEVLDKTRRPLSVFRAIVKHLHLLGVSTRIENARLSNDGNFQVLADQVEKLSIVIASKSKGIVTGVTELREGVTQTLSRVLTGNEVINERTRQILDHATSSLGALSVKHDMALQTAFRLGAGSDNVSAAISDIISSLQFHDITRQQIEHVMEVFDELGAMSRSGSGQGGDVLEALGEVGSLQADQLDQARKEMLAAVNRITKGLEAMAGHLCSMTKDTETLIGAAGKEGRTFLSELNDSVSFVIDSVRKNAETDEQLADAVRHVSGLIQHLEAFLNDIEDIAAEIELIALNAQIRAAHTSADGGALGVLAEAIRNLSDTTRSQTLEMTHTLEDVKCAAQELGSADTHRNDEEIGTITAEMKSLFNSLGQSQERLSSLLDRLKRETKELTGAIKTVTRGITVHTRTDEAVGGIIQNLQYLASLGRTAARGEAGRHASRLSELTSRYTMQQERAVHEAHLGRMPGTTFASPDFGGAENVELF